MKILQKEPSRRIVFIGLMLASLVLGFGIGKIVSHYPDVCFFGDILPVIIAFISWGIFIYLTRKQGRKV